jgi:Lipocalin-like domain
MRDKICGVWKLVSQYYEDVETQERVAPFGDHPKGYQIATKDGRWMALATAAGRKAPKTDAERSAAFRSMIAYTGRWRLDGDAIVTRVEAAWNEEWVGSEQIRFVRFEGDDRLHLESPPQPHPNLLGRMVRIKVVWQREES